MTVEAAYQVKLLAALRSGDPALIHPFLAEIGKDRRSSDLSTAAIDTGAAALHLAVRCGSAETVALLLSHRAISPNGIHPPGSGTTALHLAASLSRAEIVSLLLEQPGINDTVRDSEGRTCRDVAKGRDVIKLIDDSRSFLNASYRSLLRSYILSPISDPPSTPLLQLLESPRASLVNLSYLDDASGSSLLHEAARRKDLRLIELAVRAGADVFVRNRRGKMAHEGAGKDDKVRVFLRQFANHDRTLIQTPAPMSEPPALKGYLNKYTNVAKGYNTRWFVLAHGVLSYYRHQDDESVTSRGSISMKNALLKPSDARATRFEIHSYPSTGAAANSSASSVQKWYIRANHPVEAARWIQAITQSIEWSKRNFHLQHQQQQQPEDNSMMNDARSSYSYSNTVVKKPAASRKSTTVSVYGGGGGGDTDSINAALSGDPNLSDVGGSGLEDGTGGGGDVDDEDEDDEGAEDTSSADTGHRQPPHEAAFSLHTNSTMVQLELVQELVNNVLLSTSTSIGTTTAASAVPLSSTLSMSSRSVKSTPSSTASTSSAEDAKHTLLTSINTLHTLFAQYTSMQKDRENWFKRQLASERARQSVWEESLATVVKEGAKLEEELRVRSRRRGSRVFGFSEAFREGVGVGGGEGGVGVGGGSMSGRRRSGRYSASVVGAGPGGTLKAPLPSVVVEEEEQYMPHAGETKTATMLGGPVVVSPPPQPFVSARGEAIEEEREALRREDTVKPAPAIVVPEEEEEDGYDSADSDEFFDAIDSNNIPNLIVPPSLASPTNELALTHHFPFTNYDFSSIDHPFKGYTTLRTKLDTADERPPTSLWSVLKHSIGKDLTKISFPVFFNEPTSMLQRMTEDMEFSECLDTAATQRDSLKRLAFVAAFAMSNYSSTIGRIAKPFNPMLSETFEYVRLDKKFHYVSEQVSHHPPVSTCWAESPLWHYFGEVDAQNKFMGKSFEIRPTGIVHVELVIPEEWVSVEGKKGGDKQHQYQYQHYPKAKMGRGEGEGKVLEHYTWKKVTTNVSGFILGSPTIDHYGDMLITNHRTGERCSLTFKPRGWRGKDAFEISGQVMDASGRVVYEIAGRWNSQLIMREVGTSANGALHPDTSVASPSSSPTTTMTTRKSSTSPEYILLWKNSFKPPGSPFNLTPFAMSLNNCPKDTLRPYLAPTDCRLRPDQRAFELGKYDLANELKQKQEEKQRATRKARETGEKEPHKPRWFVVETDGDTGDRVWVPKRVKVRVRVGGNGNKGENEGGEGRVVEEEKIEYWAERERIWRARKAGKLPEEVFWKDVEEIFIEEPDEIRGI